MCVPAAAAVAQQAAPQDDPIKPAERLLFMADHLGNAGAPSDLVYELEKTGSLVPAKKDTVHVRLARNNAAGGKDLEASVSDGAGAVRLSLDTATKSNPVILYFLEKDIAEMHQLTGGQARYFQKRIRLALARAPEIVPVKMKLDGRQVQAQQIVIQPYLDDPNHERFEKLVGKRYTFVLSEQMPGKVLLLKSEIPGSGQDFAHPLQTETLRYRARK
ncbi:hypothetical protein [Cupriavidus necator]|uniref:hypothetical protein n=1 Tax=Cupriavidus necator TaxID=106590 RepID=UPI00339D93E2